MYELDPESPGFFGYKPPNMSGSLTRVGEILRKGDATIVMVCCVVLVNNVGLLGGGKMLEVEVEEGKEEEEEKEEEERLDIV